MGEPGRLAALEHENEQLRQRVARAEEKSRGLQTELQHRVRNVLSVISAIARRTAETSASSEHYALHLDGRIGAIARAQTAALQDSTGAVELDHLIAEELLAHAALEGEQISLSGPRVVLSGKALTAFWLAVHELAVNSVKFGALSTPSGWIEVTWRVERNGAGAALMLDWHERGAPPAPTRASGFGTEVIERTLGYEIGATGALEFGRSDVHCHIAAPIAEGLVIPAPTA